jgi:DNA-binding LacI/PurR family transcriptional regulator
MATIKDVAKQVGVSVSTVSYALSGKRPISAKVKSEIDEAIRELGFSRNAQAHNLRKGSSHTIGLAHPPREIMLEGSSVDFIFSASETLNPTFTLSLLPYPQSATSLLEAFRQRLIDGAILMHIARHDERVEALRKTNYPFALIGRPENTQGLNLVDFDFESAAYMAIEHLAQLGHEHIGFLDVPLAERNGDLGYAYYMQEGFERAKQDYKVKLSLQSSGRSNQASYKATLELFKRNQTITALVVVLGATYLGAARALEHLGKDIPRDCSVICLGSASMAEWVTPTVSTLDNQLTDLGRIAAELLLERISGNQEAKQILLPAKLIARQSTTKRRIS